MNDYKELIIRMATVMELEDECSQKELADIFEKSVNAIRQLSIKCRQLEKERDAAVRDLQTYGRVCHICRELDSCYSKCPRMNPKCDTIHNENWEWRGVRKEQKDEEGNGDK